MNRITNIAKHLPITGQAAHACVYTSEQQSVQFSRWLECGSSDASLNTGASYDDCRKPGG